MTTGMWVSPTSRWLGFGSLVLIAGVVLGTSATEFSLSYPRWSNTLGVLQFSLVFWAPIAAFVVAVNVSALTSPSSFFANGAFARPFGNVITNFAGRYWLLASLASLLGWFPLVGWTLSTAGLPHLSTLAAVLSIFIYLVLNIAIAAFVGLALRTVSPLISGIVSALLCLFLGLFPLWYYSIWFISPTREIYSNALSATTTLDSSFTIAFSFVGILAVLGTAWLVVRVSRGKSRVGSTLRAVGVGIAAVVLAGGGIAASATVVPPYQTVLDFRCDDTGSGRELCLSPEDDPVRAPAAETLDAIMESVPETMRGELGAADSLAAYDPEVSLDQYVPVRVDRGAGAVSMTAVAASISGWDTCSDPLGPAGYVSEETAIWILQNAGAHSTELESYGGLVASVSDSGEIVDREYLFEDFSEADMYSLLQEFGEQIKRCEVTVEDLTVAQGSR